MANCEKVTDKGLENLKEALQALPLLQKISLVFSQ